MTIVAHSRPFVVGVDTHAKNHVYAVITGITGELIATRDFPTTGAGINRAVAWVARHTGADLATLWVIEGAASYGALLAGAVGAVGYPVAEAAHMDARHRAGKSDPLDAHRIAAAVLPLEEQQLRQPRLDEGVRAAPADSGHRTGIHDHRAYPGRERVDRPAPGQRPWPGCA
ncbi:hypothetical protein QFZ23_004157 [Arthrobacter globiformis]|nr:hypothetical protein [Arthrobacter globiformis]